MMALDASKDGCPMTDLVLRVIYFPSLFLFPVYDSREERRETAFFTVRLGKDRNKLLGSSH